MSVVKLERIGEMHNIYHQNSISVTNRIRKERVKLYMGKPKRILRVIWESRFMDTYNDVYTYYTLHGRGEIYGKTMIETDLRGLMRNCLDLIKEETLIQTNDHKMIDHIYYIIVNHTPK